MKKMALVFMIAVLALTSACALAAKAGIAVISREDGSGTRGAFVELTGVLGKGADGNGVDLTTDGAIVTNSTSAMLSSVAGDRDAIGYVSLGSLDDSVRAVLVDGESATAQGVASGAYKLSRPFLVLTVGEVSGIGVDFLDYVLSADGQAVVAANGYVAVEIKPEPYISSGIAGTLTLGGSSSVTPVMEKLAEAYMAINPRALVVIRQSDSTTGITSVVEGIVDIGMASRELKGSELEKGVVGTPIAIDGIAVIVNLESGIGELTRGQIADIFTGGIAEWEQLGQ